MPAADTASSSSPPPVQLNVHASEFVPAHEHVFRHEYPSLSTTKQLRVVKKSIPSLSFHSAIAKPVRPTPPPPPPYIPSGFVSLSKASKAAVENDDPSVADVAPVETPSSIRHRTLPKRKHTKKHVAEWRAPPAMPSIPLDSAHQDDGNMPDKSLGVEGRSPGFFFLLAAQSKVQGRSSASYLDADAWTPPPGAATGLHLVDNHVSNPVTSNAATAVRAEWQAAVARLLPLPRLARADMDALESMLQTHRSMQLWDDRDAERRNAWHLAAMYGHDEVLHLLSGLGDGTDARDRRKMTPLHVAAACGHVSSARLLLQLGASPAAVDKNGQTPFHVACRQGHVGCVKILLHKSKLDGRTKHRDTPLLLAVASAAAAASTDATMEIVQLLLAAGANALATNHVDHSALYLSLAAPTLALADLLLVYGYPASTKASVFRHAVALGHVNAIRLLVAVVPTTELLSMDKEHGDSVLHTAIRSGHADATMPLLCTKQSKLLAMENKALLTPLFLAIHLNDAAAVAALLAHGGYPNERNRRQHSALYESLRLGHKACTRVLIEFDCQLDAACIDFVKRTAERTVPEMTQLSSDDDDARPWDAASADLAIRACANDEMLVRTHRCIVVARCPVFRAQLVGLWASTPTATASHSILLDVAAPTTIDLLQTYWYFGVLATTRFDEVGVDGVVDLLVVANGLLLFDLQQLCLVWLQQRLSPRDVADVATQLDIAVLPPPTSLPAVVRRMATQWQQDMQQLLAEAWFADAAFESADGVTIPCHRAVVAPQSPVLRLAVDDDTNDDTSLVVRSFRIPHSTKALELLALYLYTHTIACETLPRDLLLEVAEASIALALWSCLAAVETHLVRQIQHVGDVDLLAFADRIAPHMPHLRAACRVHLLEAFAHDKTILLQCLT
ncbi:Aste57867_12162 [Aphanomyces stellatus]|uniref:Aste57867_12162 protein n=1 Tax=Aphanomyces stellatus TaxID=120398 RepID=A0A485KUT1_9STRA|nr:hypothetical protein As57867_012117 [Aphanomyces stellatus]VFT89016.1 Aste57867_12162 [Aphanomyces stellatus]